jgi:CRP/FNR family transcriptional regulator, anaerobic regulatory protein
MTNMLAIRHNDGAAMHASVSSVNTERQASNSAPNWMRSNNSLCKGLGSDELLHMGSLGTIRIQLGKGDPLYQTGDRFHALYAICVGSCKTALLGRDGQEQVAGYHMAGDVIGTDGMASNAHECRAAALENVEICRLSFDELDDFARLNNQFRHNLQQLLSDECARVRALSIVLGTMSAEQRLSVFLLELSQRYKARGFSPCEFVLRLTREEIGSYLGLKLETVSRMLTRFQRDGIIQVEGRLVKLLDLVALRRIVDCGAPVSMREHSAT